MQQYAIKFRVWDEERKSISPVGAISWDEMGVQRVCDDRSRVVVNPALMQFTGLIDRNKAEVYAGDIIALPDGDDPQGRPSRKTYTVGWHMGRFAGRTIPRGSEIADFEPLFWKQAVMEIIGNIHENPELLDRLRA